MIAYVINPGTSGLKLACATIAPSDNAALPGQLRLKLERAELPLPHTPSIHDLPELVQKVLEITRDWPEPAAVVGRGGMIGQVPAGTYHVTPDMAEYAVHSDDGSLPHVSNLGVPLALAVAQARGVPAFVVDPQSVDELIPEARETGVRGVKRRAEYHALNARVAARRAAHDIGKRLQDARIVVAHLGATSSVTAFEKGRAIDSSGTGPDGGPMGAVQSGPLPTRALLKLAQDYGVDGTLKLLAGASGMQSLTGSASLKDLEAREAGEEDVRAAVAAFVHQACKATMEQVGALQGRPDAIVLTGGAARWDALMDRIERRLAWVAPILVIPGELELEALAEGAGRVLLSLEAARDWKPPTPHADAASRQGA